ncbi:MAG: hypothetical protein LUC88_05870, partial [Prevotella sp.]|nr:hypothetical protein [Prevotella sp.]
MDETLVSRVSKRYYKYSLRIIVGIALLSLLVVSVRFSISTFAVPLVVSVLFSLLSSWGYCAAWKSVAKSSPGNLTKLYLASSIFRLLFAAIVMIIYCLINKGNREAIFEFLIIFCTYYVALLIFDCIY